MAVSKAETLPQEITSDILSRLPIKSIGQFRCVSKQWRSLLSDPHFIRTHLTLHSHKQQQEEKLILVSSSQSLNSITFNHNPENGINAVSRKLDFEELSDNWLDVAGSCNGLVLAVTWEKIPFLINPTTLKYHRIPNLHMALPVPGSSRHYGLGYDVVSDDYKVVDLSHYDDEYNLDIRTTFVDVYFVKKGLWRRVESSPYDHAPPVLTSGVLVNGGLHWLATKTCDDSSVIAAFGLSDEKFSEVPPPRNLDTGFEGTNLGVLRGCLCMFHGTDEDTFTVWMMKDYGVKESWIEFRISGPDLLDDSFIYTMTDEDVVFDVEGKLVVYNMKENQWRDMIVDVSPFMYSARTLTDSLVSPFAEGTEG